MNRDIVSIATGKNLYMQKARKESSNQIKYFKIFPQIKHASYRSIDSLSHPVCAYISVDKNNNVILYILRV